MKQECIPVGCVPPAAVAIQGGLHQAPPGTRHPPGPGTPGTRPPLGPDIPRDQAPPGQGTPWDQAPPHEQNHRHL